MLGMDLGAKVRVLFTLALFLSLVGVSRQARADISSTALATDCITDTYSAAANLDTSVTGQATNKTGSPLVVHCPIVKRTSGPGVTNDAIYGVDIPVAANAAGFSCMVNLWASQVDANQSGQSVGSNWRDQQPAAVVSSTKLHVPGLTETEYWDGGFQRKGWLYADLTCTLPAHGTLKNFTVFERGSVVNAGYQIYPAVACSNDASNKILWHYEYSTTGPGGLLWGQAALDLPKFAMKCKVPNNVIVNYSVGPAIHHFIGCNLNSSNFSNFSWDAYLDTEWPSQMIPTPAEQPFMTTPITGTNLLMCGVNDPQGDGKLISYRTRPNPNRSAWVVKSLHGSGQRNAIDNSASTRFTTGTKAVAGDYYQVDFGSFQDVMSITMDSGSSTGDFARSFDVQTSDDGNTFTTVVTGNGSAPFIRQVFQETFTRYVRIKLNAGLPNNNWWSIHELNIYGIADGG